MECKTLLFFLFYYEFNLKYIEYYIRLNTYGRLHFDNTHIQQENNSTDTPGYRHIYCMCHKTLISYSQFYMQHLHMAQVVNLFSLISLIQKFRIQASLQMLVNRGWDIQSDDELSPRACRDTRALLFWIGRKNDLPNPQQNTYSSITLLQSTIVSKLQETTH